MIIDWNTTITIVAGLIGIMGSIYATYRHFKFAKQVKKDKEKEAILSEARSEISRVESALEEKIKTLQVELEAHKLLVSKDFSYFKEVHNAEIKNLGEKIEQLRADLSDNHSQMIALLTKLIDH